MVRTARTVASVTIALAASLAPAAAPASPVHNRLVVFGDSYSDEGNVPLNLPGYYMNRRSNGPVWVEDLAGLVEAPVPTASRPGGPNATNFAYAGAPAAGFNPNDTSLPNLGAQVNLFLKGHSPAPGDLYVIEIGGIDFIRSGQTNVNVPANAIVNQVKRLAGMGARSFLVANVVPVGSWPDYLGTADGRRFEALVGRFNQTLADDLTALRPTLDPTVDVRRFDPHGLFTDAIANPAGYGFTNVTQGANDVHAADPDHYVVWDFGHPTRAMHDVMARRSYEVLAAAPEPAVGMPLVLFGGTLLLRRRPR